MIIVYDASHEKSMDRPKVIKVDLNVKRFIYIWLYKLRKEF